MGMSEVKKGTAPELTNADLEVVDREGATDEDIREQLCGPRWWSYIVRDRGAVVCFGKGSLRECEREAVLNAEACAVESMPDAHAGDRWRWAVGWRFTLWPPQSFGESRNS